MANEIPDPEITDDQREYFKSLAIDLAQERHDTYGCDDLDPSNKSTSEEDRVYCTNCRLVLLRIPTGRVQTDD